jgi:hypothetical protein
MSGRKVGRPVGSHTKYKPEFCDEIVEAARGGISPNVWIMQKGFTFSAMKWWTEHRPEFAEARSEADQAYAAWYEKFITAAAAGKVEKVQPSLAIWLGKNKCGWRDKSEVQLNANVTIDSDLDKIMEKESIG